MGAVRRPDLAERDPRPFHDRRHTEGATDLHQLAPGHDRGPAQSEGVEGEQDRRGVVVDDVRGLGPGECNQLRLELAHARPAATGFEIELQTRVAVDGARDRSAGGLGERGATEIGVEQDTGRVHHGARMRGSEASRLEVDGLPDHLGLERDVALDQIPLGNRLAKCGHLGACGGRQRPFRQIGSFQTHFANQAIHRRNHPAGVRVDLSLRIHDPQPQFLHGHLGPCSGSNSLEARDPSGPIRGHRTHPQPIRERPLPTRTGWPSRTMIAGCLYAREIE